MSFDPHTVFSNPIMSMKEEDSYTQMSMSALV
jgi:hypothetical protein